MWFRRAVVGFAPTSGRHGEAFHLRIEPQHDLRETGTRRLGVRPGRRIQRSGQTDDAAPIVSDHDQTLWSLASRVCGSLYDSNIANGVLAISQEKLQEFLRQAVRKADAKRLTLIDATHDYWRRSLIYLEGSPTA